MSVPSGRPGRDCPMGDPMNLRPRPSVPRGRRNVHRPSLISEPLEPRTLFAAYDAQSLIERFNLPQVIFELSSPSPNAAGFGAAAAALGDVNNDGHDDFAISATGAVNTGGTTTVAGTVFVYSGATGLPIRTLTDNFADFGISLAAMADINGDSVLDLIVGSPRFDDGTSGSLGPKGAAYVYSGATGLLLRTYVGQRPSGEFGTTVAPAGFANNDTIPDVMVGAPNDGSSNQGRLYLMTGADVPANQQIIRFFTGEANGDRFGAAIAPADLQTPAQGADATPDYLVGAPNADAGGIDSGRVYLYRNSDGLLAFTLGGGAGGDHFGASILTIKDSTQATIIVGAPGTDVSVTVQNSGAYQRFAASGAQLGVTTFGPGAGAAFGSTIAAVGDVNDDGVQDFSVASPGVAANAQTMSFYSASNGSVIALSASQLGDFGTAVLAAGDVDNDGIPDVISLVPQSFRVEVLSSFAVVPPAGVTGASDDLSFIFYRDWMAETTVPTYRTAYAFVNGVYKKFSEIPGLFDTDVVFGVNNSDLIAGAVVIPSAVPFVPPSLGDRFIVQNGVRTLIQNAVTQIVGGQLPTYGSFQVAKVGNDGSILYTDDGAGQRSWLFKNGVLTFLWYGNVFDVNSSGAVVGNPFDGGFFVTPVRRDASGAVTQLNGLAAATAIIDSGVVYGVSFNNEDNLQPVRWSNGVVSVLAPASALGQHFFETMRVDANNDGLALVSATYLSGNATPSTFGVFTPSDGLEYLPDVVFGGGSPVPIAMSASGTIVTVAGLDVAVAPEVPWTLVAGSPVTHAATSTQTVTIGLSVLGDIIALTRSASGAWSGAVITLSGGDSADVSSIIAYTDPALDRVFVFIVAGFQAYWSAADDGSQPAPLPSAAQTSWTSIISNTSLFITSSNTVTLAGTDLNGNLVIYFQNHQFNASDIRNWSYRNLTTQDVEAGGQTFVPVSGGLTSFATTWGGQNIAYLDETGDVYTVWWAPGQTLWHLDNLSDIAGAPAITGPLSPLTTPWNGLNVIGTDPQGFLVTIWWAPDTVWQYARFIDSPDVPKLDSTSITTFTTPWNAMSIVGRDLDTGLTIAYWWVPGFTSWRADELLTPSRPAGVVTTGRFSGGMVGSSQVLFAREASTGHFTEIFWLPGGTTWDVADLTVLVA